MYASDYLVGSGGTNNRHHQVSDLGVDALGVQWILPGAWSKTRKVTQLAPVTERHLYSSAPGCFGVHERPIRNEFDALLHSEHPRVLHLLVGVAVGELHGAIYQADGKDVLTIDIRHRAVVDNACTVLGKPGDDAGNVVGGEAVLPAQGE